MSWLLICCCLLLLLVPPKHELYELVAVNLVIVILVHLLDQQVKGAKGNLERQLQCE